MSAQNYPKAVLWDYDGSLLDTEPVWVGCEIEMLSALGVPWSYAEGFKYSGSAWQVSAAAFRKRAQEYGTDFAGDDWQIARELQERVAAHIANNELPWVAGAKELLDELVAANIPMAIVSASPMDVLEAGIKRMPAGAFQEIVTGLDVSQGKPHPEGYLLAAKRLGFEAWECLVIEDSRFGVQAGANSGAAVIAVPSVNPVEQMPGVLKVGSLSEVTLADLTDIWAKCRAEHEALSQDAQRPIAASDTMIKE